MQTNPLHDTRLPQSSDQPCKGYKLFAPIAAAMPQWAHPDDGFAHAAPRRCGSIYNKSMQKKIFWTTFAVLGLIADFALPLWWALFATIPIGYISWWFAYRSDWF
jgi:hypothetical protein